MLPRKVHDEMEIHSYTDNNIANRALEMQQKNDRNRKIND